MELATCQLFGNILLWIFPPVKWWHVQYSNAFNFEGWHNCCNLKHQQPWKAFNMSPERLHQGKGPKRMSRDSKLWKLHSSDKKTSQRKLKRDKNNQKNCCGHHQFSKTWDFWNLIEHLEPQYSLPRHKNILQIALSKLCRLYYWHLEFNSTLGWLFLFKVRCCIRTSSLGHKTVPAVRSHPYGVSSINGIGESLVSILV